MQTRNASCPTWPSSYSPPTIFIFSLQCNLGDEWTHILPIVLFFSLFSFLSQLDILFFSIIFCHNTRKRKLAFYHLSQSYVTLFRRQTVFRLFRFSMEKREASEEKIRCANRSENGQKNYDRCIKREGEIMKYLGGVSVISESWTGILSEQSHHKIF